MVRALLLGIAAAFVALTAGAHDPEGKWDYWFPALRSPELAEGKLVDFSSVGGCGRCRFRREAVESPARGA